MSLCLCSFVRALKALTSHRVLLSASLRQSASIQGSEALTGVAVHLQPKECF